MQLCSNRGGVKFEFVLNSFDSKICDSIDLKGQKIFEKFDENEYEILSIWFDSNYRVESNFSDAGFVWNSFNSIRKFMTQLIWKVKNKSNNSMKIYLKFVRFDSTSIGDVNLQLLGSNTINIGLSKK